MWIKFYILHIDYGDTHSREFVLLRLVKNTQDSSLISKAWKNGKQLQTAELYWKISMQNIQNALLSENYTVLC